MRIDPDISGGDIAESDFLSSLKVNISAAAVPERSSVTLFDLSILILVGYRRGQGTSFRMSRGTQKEEH